MASFGENLRREREMRSVSIDEIAASTKINPRLLRALEDDDFAKLPGGVFTRSFIRAYASYLGLEVEQVMAEYNTIAHPEDVDFAQLSAARPLAVRKGSNSALLAWLTAIVLLGGGYALFRYSHRTPETNASPMGALSRSASATPLASTNRTGTAVANGTTSGSSTFPPVLAAQNPTGPASSGGANGTGAAGTSTAEVKSPPATSAESAASGRPAQGGSQVSAASAQPVGQGGLVLQVVATERTWVAIDADGETIFQRIMNPNEVRAFRAKSDFEVVIGNAQGVALTLNGETLKPLGREGEFKRIHLSQASLHNPGPLPR